MNRLPITGEEFGRYRLVRKLGQGGMGVVYAAHDPALNREVALKLVVPHLAGDDGFRARFQHEAEVLAQLDSPRVVKIFDHGEHDETLFLVTQLIDGGDLHKLVNAEGALPPALATNVLAQVVEGLCDAHAVGVTHRDIKPANVLLRERGRELEAFLCDFGIATTAGADLSRTGTVAGSLPYMAPERHQGEQAGAQGDVYAAGCLLWHTLTGTAPYAGTDVEVAMAHLQAPIPVLPGKDAFSQRANAVIAKAMAKDPKKRYPTARAMLTDLRQLSALAPDAISLPGATSIRQPVIAGVRRRSWRPAVTAALAALAVVASTAVAFSAMSDRRGGSAEPPVQTTGTLAPGIGPTTTLLPKPVTVRRDGKLVTVAPGMVTALPEAPLEGAVPPLPAGVRTVTQAPTRRPPATTAPPAAPPPPAYKYQCWDGRKVMALTECTNPRGAAGAAWMHSAFNQLACKPRTPPDARMLELFACTYSAAGATDNQILFVRLRTAADALSWLRDRAPVNRQEATWSTGTVVAGKRVSGSIKLSTGTRARWGRYWNMGAGSWAVLVDGANSDAVAAGTSKLSGWRHINWVKGTPL